MSGAEQFKNVMLGSGIKLNTSNVTEIFNEILDSLEYGEPVTIRVDFRNSKGEVLGMAFFSGVNHD
jgi:hypothetical protein